MLTDVVPISACGCRLALGWERLHVLYHGCLRTAYDPHLFISFFICVDVFFHWKLLLARQVALGNEPNVDLGGGDQAKVR